jgi:hypothetical protein
MYTQEPVPLIGFIELQITGALEQIVTIVLGILTFPGVMIADRL